MGQEIELVLIFGFRWFNMVGRRFFVGTPGVDCDFTLQHLRISVTSRVDIAPEITRTLLSSHCVCFPTR